jgi:hypothetical protein
LAIMPSMSLKRGCRRADCFIQAPESLRGRGVNKAINRISKTHCFSSITVPVSADLHVW